MRHDVRFDRVLQHVDVAHDHRPLGDNADRRRGIAQRFEHASRQLVGALDRLVGIGGRAESDRLLHPGGLGQLAPQHLDEVGLHEDDGREVIARIQLELGLILAREAVVTAVRAAAIGIERPLEERHALHPVERRAAADLLVGRGVAATPGVGQRLEAAVLHQPGDVPGGGRATEVEQQWKGRHRDHYFAVLFACQPQKPEAGLLACASRRAGRRRSASSGTFGGPAGIGGRLRDSPRISGVSFGPEARRVLFNPNRHARAWSMNSCIRCFTATGWPEHTL